MFANVVESAISDRGRQNALHLARSALKAPKCAAAVESRLVTTCAKVRARCPRSTEPLVSLLNCAEADTGRSGGERRLFSVLISYSPAHTAQDANAVRRAYRGGLFLG